ncbi:MAG: 4Fe-4S dicluster domain-containing protein [Deltaproteobacteria bacterium]|nr:4Fe-4S dicluster domain-containing protein [Deltaproteobacteria bacterium]
MGHLATKATYKKLRERLDLLPVGAPGQSTIYEILKITHTPEEAELCCQMPLKFSTLGALSRKLGIPRDSLRPKLETMADKGLILDMLIGGKMRYMITPTIIGFIEFSMMRIRDDVDQKHLANLYHRYLLEEPDFANQFKPGTKTSLFRTLVHETTLPENYTEVLDWERATHIVESAVARAVSLCHCRHVTHHRGEDCKKIRMEVCLSLNIGADYLSRHGLARLISKEEALDLLVETREAGLVHLGDNVQNRPGFICNCCGCCCEVMGAMKNFGMFENTFSSNFEARVDNQACTGCKKCQKACPANAIDIIDKPRTKKGKKYKFLAKVDPKVCLGCGVCIPECKFDSMAMVPRAQRRITPRSTFTRVLTMALEQGKLHQMLIDADSGVMAHTANAMLGAILDLPPAKQLLARDELRSRFIEFLISGAKKAGIEEV